MNPIAQNVLDDVELAKAVIPDLGIDMSPFHLDVLGREVQSGFRELRRWPGELAAKAFLLYGNACGWNPAALVEPGNDFLQFVRDTLTNHDSGTAMTEYE